MIIRAARSSDLDALTTLAASIDGGMTSLPQDQKAWEKKLALVDASFANQADTQLEALFFLVLEDPHSGAIAGTAAIYTGVGLSRPFYNYQLSKHVRASQSLGITVTHNTLNLVNDFTGDTELGSLYLAPKYRGRGYGQLLSYCRFAMMNDFPEKFGEHVFAEIRGWLDDHGESPFWQHLGKKFFNLSYREADHVCAVHGAQFISDLMPQHPIYLELLPDQAVRVIGVAHKDSHAAMQFLINAGFRFQGAVDIFDAGPVVECNRAYIQLLKESKVVQVAAINAHVNPQITSRFLVSNRNLHNYRMAILAVEINGEGSAILSQQDAARLDLQVGASIQLMKIEK